MHVSDRVIYADFLHMKERDDVCPGRLSIPLGNAEQNAGLANFQEDDLVLLAEPGSFHARARIHIVERDGRRWYYGILQETVIDDTGDHVYAFEA